MNPLAIAVATIAAGLALAAFSGTEQAEGGWQWVGEGKPGEFTLAASHCRRSVTQMRRPDRHVSELINKRVSYLEQHAYRQCMKKRGWMIRE